MKNVKKIQEFYPKATVECQISDTYGNIADAVTKENNKNIEKLLGQGEMYNIFIATAPNPTSGFYLIAKKTECIELKISVEETFKSIISAGAISPKMKMEE